MILGVPGVHNSAGDMGEPWHLVSSLQPKVILSPRVLKNILSFRGAQGVR